MAKFDVYRQKGRVALLLDCQADLLDDLNTRFVVPLIPVEDAPRPAARLNPVFEIEGKRVVMATQFAAAISLRELDEKLGSLSGEQDAIGNALDMLISGF